MAFKGFQDSLSTNYGNLLGWQQGHFPGNRIFGISVVFILPETNIAPENGWLEY